MSAALLRRTPVPDYQAVVDPDLISIAPDAGTAGQELGPRPLISTDRPSVLYGNDVLPGINLIGLWWKIMSERNC